MFAVQQATITAPSGSARGVRNQIVTAAFAAVFVRPVSGAARGSVGQAPSTRVWQATTVEPPIPTVVADRSVTAEPIPIQVPTVAAPITDLYTTLQSNVPVDLPDASVVAPVVLGRITDQPATVVVPLDTFPPASEQMIAQIRQGFRGLKARGSGSQGFAIRNPQTGAVWFSSNDIVWSQADFFIVNGGSDTTKTYGWLKGWEVLVTQAFTGTPPSNRKMLQMNTSWNPSTQRLRVWGGSERTMILVLAR